MSERVLLGDFLVSEGVINIEQLSKLLVLQKELFHAKKLGELVVDEGYITREKLSMYLSKHLDAEFSQKAQVMLQNFHEELEHIEASAVVTRDGITLAALLSDQANKERFGAMCASLLALATRAAAEVHRGALRQVILDGDKGPMLLTAAGAKTVLAVAAHPDANIGRLIYESRKTAYELGDIQRKAWLRMVG